MFENRKEIHGFEPDEGHKRAMNALEEFVNKNKYL